MQQWTDRQTACVVPDSTRVSAWLDPGRPSKPTPLSGWRSGRSHVTLHCRSPRGRGGDPWTLRGPLGSPPVEGDDPQCSTTGNHPHPLTDWPASDPKPPPPSPSPSASSVDRVKTTRPSVGSNSAIRPVHCSTTAILARHDDDDDGGVDNTHLLLTHSLPNLHRPSPSTLDLLPHISSLTAPSPQGQPPRLSQPQCPTANGSAGTSASNTRAAAATPRRSTSAMKTAA